MSRAPFVPTDEQRRRVSIAAGAGMPHGHIAMALNIDAKTLLKYFSHDLTVGAHERRLEVVEALHRAAEKGSVPACKAYPTLLQPPTVLPADEVPDGKKAQRNAAAKVAQEGTKWQELLPPSVQ